MPTNAYTCPHCGARITPFAAGCAYCGADLDLDLARRRRSHGVGARIRRAWRAHRRPAARTTTPEPGS
jgi:DNA-directed RNA polymerase subunit RPC12/RpoP